MHQLRILKRVCLALGSVLVVMLVAGMCVATWLGTSALVSPPRRELQDYHRSILSSPNEHGLSIREFVAKDGTPCLVCEPSPNEGAAAKSLRHRQILNERNVGIAPWGDIVGTVALLHGHRGRKEDHLPIAERFCASGFRCVLIDVPGHGESPYPHATFGVFESPLVGQWIDEASAALGFDPKPCALFGVSQGGAIAIQAAARDGADRWFAVAAVATFDRLDSVVRSAACNLHRTSRKISKPACLLLRAGTLMRAGFEPRWVRPVDAAAHLQMPVLIAHGTADAFAASECAYRIFNAVPHRNKELRLVEGAGHNNVLAKESHALYADIAEFYLTALRHHTQN